MIVSIANRKGGSGKTSTAAAIVSGATLRGKKALAIDADPQCNLSVIMDGHPGGVYEFITQGTREIQHTDQGDLIGGDEKMAAADSTLTGDARVYGLKRAILPLKEIYSVIVVDCPPSLGTPLINALTASDGVVVPMRARMTNVQGLYSLAKTVDDIRTAYNPGLQFLGILLTEHNARTIAERTVTEEIRTTADQLGIPVFNTAIRRGIAVEESQIVRQSLFTYAPRSNPAQDYAAFLDELGV